MAAGEGQQAKHDHIMSTIRMLSKRVEKLEGLQERILGTDSPATGEEKEGTPSLSQVIQQLPSLIGGLTTRLEKVQGEIEKALF